MTEEETLDLMAENFQLKRDHDARVQHWNAIDEVPNGTRFVAIFNDGSGAILGAKIGGAEIDENGDDMDFGDGTYIPFIALPAGVQLWCDVRLVDQMTLEPKGGAQ